MAPVAAGTLVNSSSASACIAPRQSRNQIAVSSRKANASFLAVVLSQGSFQG